MEIVIKNCNSIDEAKISIEKDKLNIKYGMNGIGKSTIAKAIELSAKPDADLSSLTSFKYKAKVIDEKFRPLITGAESIKSTSIFNEGYINQFVFKQDEVVKNSFNIFIKNAEYDKKMEEIEKLVSDIKDTFTNKKELEGAIKDLMDLSDSFGKSQTGYSKAGRIAKAIGSGNKVENIPAGLEDYADYIKSENNVKWIKWQIDGNNFLEISSVCPYCTFPTKDRKEKILSVSKEYDAKSIEHLNALRGILDRLGKYFSKETVSNLEAIVKNKTDLKKEEITYLTNLKSQIDTLIEKLNDMRGISFFLFKDVEKVVEKISSLKIDIKLLPDLNSDDTNQFVDALNKSLDLVLSKAGLLQGEINKQKAGIENTIKKHNREINEFLKYAGYKYSVDIQNDGDTYKMKLKHVDSQENIENASLCLSYGERNAFSLVLFMYETLANNPDLIILDDPISSFDKNKKFAIIEMLFRGEKSFRGRTVLMFTHDIEPIIDMIKSLSHKFPPTPSTYFLKLGSGVVSEINISKSDILTFTQVCDENITEHLEDIIKLIYLRRYYEILDDKGLEYQLLSSLFHKKAHPDLKQAADIRLMTQVEILSASTNIKKKLPNFDYMALFKRISDDKNMALIYKSTNNNYEKLQLFRIINNQNHDNDVIRKYINETFHIENEYVMQLNPHKYDFVPEYIVNECGRLMQN